MVDLKYIFKYVLDHCQEDMEFFNTWMDASLIATLEHVVRQEFVRVSYTEAVTKLEKAKITFEFPIKWGADLQSEHERYLTEQVYKKP